METLESHLLRLADPEFLFKIIWYSALALFSVLIFFTLCLVILKRIRTVWTMYQNRQINLFNHTIYEFVDSYESLLENILLIDPLRKLNWINRKVLEGSILRLAETFAGLWGERLCFLFDELGFTDEEIRKTKSFGSEIRARSARRLGQMKCRKAISALTLLLKDRSTKVRINAAGALAKIGALESLDIAVESLANYSKLAAIQVEEMVLSAPKASVPILLKMCDHSEISVQLFAIHLLGTIQDSRSKATLLRLYRSESMEIRIACLKALQSLEEEGFFAAFLPRLDDPQLPWQERAQIAKMMGIAQCREAIPSLQKSLCDSNWWVRKNAGEALSKMGQQGIKSLVDSLNLPDRFARDMAVQWLDESGYIETSVLSSQVSDPFRERLIKKLDELGFNFIVEENRKISGQ